MIDCWHTKRLMKRSKQLCGNNEINWTQWNYSIGFGKDSRRWQH